MDLLLVFFFFSRSEASSCKCKNMIKVTKKCLVEKRERAWWRRVLWKSDGHISWFKKWWAWIIKVGVTCTSAQKIVLDIERRRLGPMDQFQQNYYQCSTILINNNLTGYLFHVNKMNLFRFVVYDSASSSLLFEQIKIIFWSGVWITFFFRMFMEFWKIQTCQR